VHVVLLEIVTRMRTLVLASAMSAALVAVAFGCDEHFPKSLDETADGGADVAAAPLPPLEANAPATIAADKRVNASSSSIAFDKTRGTVWVANGDVGTLSEVDVDHGKVNAEVALGGEATALALSPDGAFVATVDRSAGTATLVYAETHLPARTIAVGTHPRACLFDSFDPRWLYVATEEGIAVVDRTAGALARVMPAGRLPAGLAMSASAQTLIASHRIDAKVTFLDPTQDAPMPTDAALADTPKTDDPKTPNGRPFAFEGLALDPTGGTLWLPHQLFAGVHPFQFQSVIFPAVSVVDTTMMSEVFTTVSSGTTDGRKNLFDAINVLEATGDPMVFSQPCAAAFHPHGDAAYVLACGSEDFLTFDVTQGIAIAAIRDLPGDHPSALVLDDTGARAFVYASESHDLTTIDTRGGSITDRARVFGTPVKTVAKDPVDPQLRLGRTLFFRASSRKGDLTTTGNNWMSCNACHLDGFGHANQVFFEALTPDQKVDAQRGHSGLRDLFASAPSYATAAFDPHDILVALSEQGGLAPDHLGLDRTGAIDPNAPTDAARAMAASIARVVARDLPLGPSWLLTADKNDPSYDTSWCGGCHAKEYAAWKQSVHSHAGSDTMVSYCTSIEVSEHGAGYGRLCGGCHSPTDTRRGTLSATNGSGVTCRGCHDTSALIHAGGNADIVAETTIDWTTDHKAAATAGLATLRTPEFCGTCHQQFVPGTGVIGIDTFNEFTASSYAATKTCVDCHMPKDMNVADHAALGGNVYVATIAGDTDSVAVLQTRLAATVTLVAARAADNTVVVTATNVGAAHSFPTGNSDLKEAWVELQAVDAQKTVVARYGSALTTGIAAAPGRLGLDFARASGATLERHELSEATSVSFDRRIPAQGSVALTLGAPATLPTGATELDAVLFYRNVKTTYAHAAGGADPPLVEMARVKVP
jgi:DNA-binding beta-propeller fold protein YncE